MILSHVGGHSADVCEHAMRDLQGCSKAVGEHSASVAQHIQGHLSFFCLPFVLRTLGIRSPNACAPWCGFKGTFYLNIMHQETWKIGGLENFCWPHCQCWASSFYEFIETKYFKEISIEELLLSFLFLDWTVFFQVGWVRTAEWACNGLATH